MTELSALNVKITGDAGDLKGELNAVQSELKQTGVSASAAQGKLSGLSKGISRASRTTARATKTNGNFGRSVQNASFQLGDFAVQVGSGQSATRALAQQLPQLLGGFGVLGAVAGAAVAVLVPLGAAMHNLAKGGQDVTQVFGVLQPLAQAVGQSFAAMGELAIGAGTLLVNNIDRILITAGTLAGLMAGKWAVAFVAARVATFSLAGALTFLRGALIRTGIGALVVGAGELIYQFTRLAGAAGGFGAALGLLWDVGKESFNRISLSVQLLKNAFDIVINDIQYAWVNGLGKMQLAFAQFLDGIAANAPAFMGLSGGNADAVMSQLGPVLDELTAANVELWGQRGSINAALDAPFESITKIKELLAAMKEGGFTLSSILGIGEDGEGEDGLKSKLGEQEKAIAEHLERIKALTQGSLNGGLGAWGKYYSHLSTLTQTNNQKLLGISKTFAAGQALIDAWVAHNKVLADPTLPWYARIASAGTVLAAGLGAVNAIKSVSAGGGGSAGAGAAGASAPSAPATSREVAISLTGGDMFGRDQVIGMVNAINEAVEDGVNLRLV